MQSSSRRADEPNSRTAAGSFEETIRRSVSGNPVSKKSQDLLCRVQMRDLAACASPSCRWLVQFRKRTSRSA